MDGRTRERENITNSTSCSFNACHVGYKSLCMHLCLLFLCTNATNRTNQWAWHRMYKRAELRCSIELYSQNPPISKCPHLKINTNTVGPKVKAAQGQNHHFCLGRREETETQDHISINLFKIWGHFFVWIFSIVFYVQIISKQRIPSGMSYVSPYFKNCVFYITFGWIANGWTTRNDRSGPI